jgi:very-short-patch-repair endonuclease
MSRLKNKEYFIKRSREVHGNRYEYSKSIYTSAKTKLEIICEDHGSFFIRPNDHYSGSGCPKCGVAKRAKYRTNTTSHFIKKAKEVHGNSYDYSITNYTSSRDSVNIRCVRHDLIFTQNANKHLTGSGCSICAVDKIKNKQKMSLEEFISKANKIHMNKYDYSLVEFSNCQDRIKIICKKGHGVFEQRITTHIHGGRSGCPHCSEKYKGRNEKDYFIPYLEENIDIKFIPQYEVLTSNSRYVVDVYFPTLNTVVEYDEYYHFVGDNHQKDRIREEEIKEVLGCDFIRINDREFMKDNNYACEILNDYFTKAHM